MFPVPDSCAKARSAERSVVVSFAFSGFGEEEAVNRSRSSAAILNGTDPSFEILHDEPVGHIEPLWRACLADSDFPTHYTAPEYFCEPMLRGTKPFAILSIVDEDVTAVMTGIHNSDRVESGLPLRPQIAFARHADRSRAMNNLIGGLLQESKSAKLVDLFLWSDTAGLVDACFRQRTYEGVVMLDLSLGPDPVFREFTKVRRKRIRRAIKHGVTVEPAKSCDDISAYYAVHVDWTRRRSRPIIGEEQFQALFASGRNRRLLLARYNGGIVAGVVLRFFPGGVVEVAANGSLESALYLRPNDLLFWRAIEWACVEGLTKCNLGGANLFLRQFGGKVVQTTRHRLDLSLFRRFAIGDWMADRVEGGRQSIPPGVAEFGRSLRSHVRKLRS